MIRIWLADLIGALSMFALPFLLLFVAHGMGWT